MLLSCLAACVKYLGDGVPTGQIIFVRGVISMVVLAFIAWRVEGLHDLAHGQVEVARAALVGGHGEHVLLVHGAHDDPARGLHGHQLHGADVPDACSRWCCSASAFTRIAGRALAIGFVGVLITIGPHLTLGGSSVGVLVAFGAAVFSALAIATLRSMSGSGGEHPLAITFYFSLTTVLVFGGDGALGLADADGASSGCSSASRRCSACSASC